MLLVLIGVPADRGMELITLPDGYHPQLNPQGSEGVELGVQFHISSD